MGKLGNHARLALEALLKVRIRRTVGGQHFARDRSVETWIVSAIDLPHPASSEGAHDLVWPQFRSQGKAHQLLTLVPAFYVLKQQQGKRTLIKGPAAFNGISKGFAPAPRKLLSNRRRDSRSGGGHETKPSGQRSPICCESSGERKLGRFGDGRRHAVGARRYGALG